MRRQPQRQREQTQHERRRGRPERGGPQRGRPHRLRRALLGGGVVVLLGSAATLAVASRRIVAEQAAYRVPAAPSCFPSTMNRSAVLPGTTLAVSPLPDSLDASPRTQISLLGAPPKAISDVRVSGSRTGSHGGRLRAYSQGDGASFVPSSPFAAGETVNVRGKLRAGSKTARFAYHFTVGYLDALPYSRPTPPSGKDPNEWDHFRSAPTLKAPSVTVDASAAGAESGDLFAAPYAGPGPSGPMIFDGSGNLVWFDPLAPLEAAANLQVQQLYGKPVLTWWQGYIPPQGFGQGEEVMLDDSYRQVGRVHAGNGYKADLHDFHITPAGTALLTVFAPLKCNLSAVGGPSGGAVTDSIFQELDLRTALVRREWHSVDHIPLGSSYSTATGSSLTWPFDYFHMNSIDQQADGSTLISARNTWAMYVLDTRSGRILSIIGGRHSGVKLASGTRTAYQHDAEVLPNGTISVFDNGSVPKVHPQSRALVLSINPQTKAASLVAQYEHNPPLTSDSQGNMQQLANQDVFVGWGSKPYFSEFSAGGQLLYDAHFHGSYESYRGYRFAWTGAPASAPAVAATAAPGGTVAAFASWNGDTRTASWRLLAGPSASALAPVASAARAGFETSITSPGPAPFLAVQALDAAGNVLGTSPTIKG